VYLKAITATAVAAALLSSSAPALASPTRRREHPYVTTTLGPGGRLAVRAFGNCVPAQCAWGKVTGITFGTSISALTGRVFLAPYKFGFANKLVDGTVNAAGTRLTVQAYTEFTDHSGRSNYVSTDTFARG
jgi:hypothetical protein